MFGRGATPPPLFGGGAARALQCVIYTVWRPCFALLCGFGPVEDCHLLFGSASGVLNLVQADLGRTNVAGFKLPATGGLIALRRGVSTALGLSNRCPPVNQLF